MISVITAAYNILKDGRKEFFEKMMESIHSQSFPFEHIVIDDGSDDGTTKLLKEYEQNGWIKKLIISESNDGIYSAMNKGICVANGEYIHIMNTDDYVTNSDFFKLSIEAIEKNNADFSHADRIIQSRNGRADKIKKGDYLAFAFRMPVRHQTMICRKSAFDEIGLFDEKYGIASDYKFILKAILAGKKGVYIPKVFIRSLDGGASSNRQKCIEEVSDIIFETYGRKFNLSKLDCRNIYEQNLSIKDIFKIIYKIKDNKIRKSLLYGFFGEKNKRI